MKVGQVITFYSYKGGVGRTMALANIATMLSHWGYKVLMVDWDLEAPGLENYFKEFINVEAISKKKGLIDLLHPSEDDHHLDWGKVTVSIKTSIGKKPIHLITAGSRDENYYNKVRDFDVNTFYEKEDGGDKIEELRNQWKASYDFVLIDSRTGITDIGGICTIQMPDVLVMLFTPTDLGFKGTIDVANRALAAQQKLNHARYVLTILPIPSRIDGDRPDLMENWMRRFADELSDIYKSWVPKTVSRKNLLSLTKIPYNSHYSYGEKLPVIEQGVRDPAGLGYAYESVSSLIANQFNEADLLIRDRSYFIYQAHRNGNGVEQGIAQENFAQERKMIRSKKVFLSYTKVNAGIAKKLYLDFSSNGIDVWFDLESLLPGQQKDDVVRIAINEADFFLYLRDLATTTSQMLQLGEAIKSKKYIIPIETRKATNLHQHHFLKKLATVELLQESQYESVFKKILQTIESS